MEKSSSKQRWIKHLIGVSVTLLCLLVLFFQIDLSDVLEALTGFQWVYLIFGVMSLAFGYIFRIVRWSMMLKATGANASFRDCSAPFLGAIALNNVLPLRLGDFVRALVFPKAMGIAKTTATSSLIVERLLDLMTLLICLVIGIFAAHAIALPVEIKSSLLSLGIVCVFVAMLIFLFSDSLSRFFSSMAGKSTGTSSTRLQQIYAVLSKLLKSLNAMSRPRVLLLMLLVSILVWTGETGLFYLVLLGVGIESSFWIALFVMAVATLSTLLPSSPGYVGPFHLAAFTAISLTDGSTAQAAGYAILVHLSLWLPTTIAGALAIWLKPGLFHVSQYKYLKSGKK